MSFWPNRKSVNWNTVSCKNDIICDITCSGLLVLVHQYRKQTHKGVYNYVRLYTSTHYHQQMYRCSNHHYCKLEGPTVSKHYLHKGLNLVKAHSTLQVFWDGPGGMKENVTTLLLMRFSGSSYAHWMRYPSNARTLSIPVMFVVCFVLVGIVYITPGKAVARTSPLSIIKA